MNKGSSDKFSLPELNQVGNVAGISSGLPQLSLLIIIKEVITVLMSRLQFHFLIV